MSKQQRDPAELAALIEQGVSRGLDLVDAFRAATGKGPRGSGRALQVEHRRAVEANRRAVARHRGRVQGLRTQATGGAAVAGIGGTVGLLDVVTETATQGAGLYGPAWFWFTSAGIGLLVSLRARRRLRRVGPAPEPLSLVAPPPAIARNAVGAAEVGRLTAVRAQVFSMAPSLDRLYPGSGNELRRADNEAAGPLTALAERLVVLDQLQREMPGTSAARQAAASADVVRERLADGCATYDELLAAAARLLAAPDTSRSTADVLGPAVAAMLAYSHGLQRAADL